MRCPWLTVLSVLSAVPLANFATPPSSIWGDIQVKHTWNSVPASWENLGPPPTGATIDLYIALKPNRENALIDTLHEVSNPEHPRRVVFTTLPLVLFLTFTLTLPRVRYGAYLSKEQVAELVAPHQDTIELVHSWLEHYHVPPSSISRSHGGGWLTITAVPVSQADELLHASYRIYKPTGINETETILRTVSYALPAVLHPHIQMVAPTTLFVSPLTPLQKPSHNLSSEGAAMVANVTSDSDKLVRELLRRDYPPDVVTPAILRDLYRTADYVPTAMVRNSLGILGLGNEYPSPTDLQMFMTTYRTDATAAAPFIVVQLNGGGYDSSQPGKEANMDTQYASAMAYPTPQVFYSTAGNLRSSADGFPVPDDPYLVWLDNLLNLLNIPPTIAISYANPESMFPPEYAITICNLFAQLGVRGVSVLVATGDVGVGDGDCLDASGNIQFVPMFPATCPWVTSVGGTMDFDPEVAMFMSGGGFSRIFPREDYQEAAVIPYFEYLRFKYFGFYNPHGRGIPDISSQALQLAFIHDTNPILGTGTSLSAPIVAGIVSLLNDYRISTGRPPLGFLNFWLYGRGRVGLNDIKSGNNPGCNTRGFTAITGWDPVTGLGTLDFRNLQLII
ncbi:peptidase S8/S53 domain-containing protein [Lactarius quietus]|nr:peptidase S8/S53 domain-containing protein [Lactarius quietus]KAF8260610.1 peptidase S8/S53 domain-containing protein [Lactarius quietus]